ncbi:MAG TPA: carbon-nitrogen hydrolase family protein [Gaiellales bacterium]|nr:carbon-nitrogen hydrolase family protein [Gaiellales bacterium]
MKDAVTVACIQAEPVILDREATIDRVAELTRQAAAAGARLVLFPETFIPCYPSNRWVQRLAAGADEAARATFARLMRESVEVPGPACDRLGGIAREHELWLAIGVNELDGGTIYNSLLVHGPDGRLALHHRKLMPTNHERLVWGLGDGRGMEPVSAPFGRFGGLICWENLMPLPRAALYLAGLDIYLAPTADDSDAWQDSMRHIARESRCFVLTSCVFQHASSHPPEVPIAEGPELMDRGGAAILAPDGTYLAGPLYDEPGIVTATLDPDRLAADRQRFDPAGHYSRPDVFELVVRASRSATG